MTDDVLHKVHKILRHAKYLITDFVLGKSIHLLSNAAQTMKEKCDPKI